MSTFCLLPTDIKHSILKFLPLDDLYKFLATSKSFYNLCTDKFWIQKIMAEFPSYLHRQPKHMNHKSWYQRLISSGTAVHAEDDQIIGHDVWKIYELEEQIFYIDIFETLYFLGDKTHIDSRYALGPFHKTIKECYKGPDVPIKLQENVIDVYLGTNSVLLDSTGTVYSLGKKFNGSKRAGKFRIVTSNIKQIISRADIYNSCLLLSTTNTLYWLSDMFTDSTGKAELCQVASNVHSAILYDKPCMGIYYVTQDHQLISFRETLDKDLPRLKRPMAIDRRDEDQYITDIIFDSGVQNIAMTIDDILIIDTDSKLWVYDTDFNKGKSLNFPHTFTQIIANPFSEETLFLDDKGVLYESLNAFFSIKILTLTIVDTNIVSAFPTETFSYIKSR